jgi:hypothetical protein
MTINRHDKKVLFATASGLKPGNFPVGSVKSRAAARSMADRRKSASEASKAVIRVIVESIGAKSANKPVITRDVGPDYVVEIEDWTKPALHEFHSAETSTRGVQG